MNSLMWVCGLFVAVMSGCTSTSTTNTARTATEQLLISNAVDRALDKVSFTPFAGSAVFLEEKYLDGVDTKYLVASTRHRLLHSGARIVDKADDADVVLELRSGGVGTASSDSYIGTPKIGLPGMLTIPEVRLVERKRQLGSAKIGMVAFDSKSKQILGGGGVTLDQSDDANWFVMGVGPWQSGSLRDEVSERTSGQAASKRQSLPTAVAFHGVDRAMHTAPDGTTGEDIRYVSFPQNAPPAQ
ncbi:MAG: DUF6655 family protein [Planctomycetaceae bacterium]